MVSVAHTQLHMVTTGVKLQAQLVSGQSKLMVAVVLEDLLFVQIMANLCPSILVVFTFESVQAVILHWIPYLERNS